MSMPRCPTCQSDRVEPDQFNAGNNHCRACGRIAPVAAFHTPVERPLMPVRGNKARWPPAAPERPVQRRRAFEPPVEPHEVEIRRWWDD